MDIIQAILKTGVNNYRFRLRILWSNYKKFWRAERLKIRWKAVRPRLRRAGRGRHGAKPNVRRNYFGFDRLGLYLATNSTAAFISVGYSTSTGLPVGG